MPRMIAGLTKRVSLHRWHMDIWMEGTHAPSETVSALNSLTGSSANDLVGSGGILELKAGRYLAVSEK